MNKQSIIVGITLVLVVVGLTGCFGNNGDGGNVDDNGGNGGTLDNRFVGEWISDYEYEEGGFEVILTINSDGSFHLGSSSEMGGSVSMGTWIVEGNQFCFISEKGEKECHRFELSNNDITLTIFNNDNSVLMILNKEPNNTNNGENIGTLDSRFFGRWKRNDSEDDFFEFKSDGSAYAEKAGVTIVGTWEVKDNIICIYVPEEDDCERFMFSNEDKTFSIINMDYTIRYSYNKQ